MAAEGAGALETRILHPAFGAEEFEQCPESQGLLQSRLSEGSLCQLWRPPDGRSPWLAAVSPRSGDHVEEMDMKAGTRGDASGCGRRIGCDEEAKR